MNSTQRTIAIACLGLRDLPKPTKLYTLERGMAYEDLGTVRNHVRRVWK